MFTGIVEEIGTVRHAGGTAAGMRLEIALIPHTAEKTTLGALRSGEAVNVETDVLAKYVQRLLGKA